MGMRIAGMIMVVTAAGQVGPVAPRLSPATVRITTSLCA